MKILLAILLAVFAFATIAFAQDAAQVGEGSMLTALTGLTPQQQLYATWGAMILSFIGKLMGSLRSGGGLKRIIFSLWYGDTVPKVIAEDYKAELSKPPFPPAP